MDEAFYKRIEQGLIFGNDTNDCNENKLDTKAQDGVHNYDEINATGTTIILDKGHPTAIGKINAFNKVNFGFRGQLQDLEMSTNIVSTSSDNAVINFKHQSQTESGEEANINVNCAHSDKGGARVSFGEQ